MSWLLAAFIFAIFNDQKKCDFHLDAIIKNQKEHFHSIPEDPQDNYVSIINLAPWVRPKVIEQIEKNGEFCVVAGSKSFNILEGYDIAHGTLYGALWADTIIYCYTEGPSKKVNEELIVKRQKLSELDEDQRRIIRAFSNFRNNIFASMDKSPNLTIPPLYYIGSRVKVNGKVEVTSMAFCF
jgi:hypothetical protein